MNEWTQAVWIGINLILDAFVIGIMVYWGYTGRMINNEISRQEANRLMMQEYREFNGYNDKIVYAQDIVSLVLRERGEVGVRILHGTSLHAYWCDSNDLEDSLANASEPWSLTGSAKQSTYTATAIEDKLDVNKVYRGSLTYGYNGEVIGVSFVRGTLNSSGNFVEG